MENNKKNWRERKDALKQKALEIIDYEKADEGYLTLKTNGYIREVFINYDIKKYPFSPGQFVFNKADAKMMYCIGLAKSPNMASKEALWFLSEDSDSAIFFDAVIPKIISQDLIPASC